MSSTSTSTSHTGAVHQTLPTNVPTVLWRTLFNVSSSRAVHLAWLQRVSREMASQLPVYSLLPMCPSLKLRLPAMSIVHNAMTGNGINAIPVTISASSSERCQHRNDRDITIPRGAACACSPCFLAATTIKSQALQLASSTFSRHS